MAESKEVVKQDPIFEMLARYKPAITSVLPKHLTPERMLRIAHTVIYKVPKLRDCTPLSLVNGVLEIAMLGLDIGRTAHLIPYGKEATVIIDYKGFIELAHRSSQISSFSFKPVYENDLFDYEEGTGRYIKHKPTNKERGKLIAAYAIVNFRNGGFDFEVVLPPDIEATKKKAPGAKRSDSPWNKVDEEWTMWCKTAVRRLAKRIPQSPELQKAAYLEELVEAGLKQSIDHVTEDIIDADFKTVKQPDNVVDTEKVKEDVDKKLSGLKANKQTEPEEKQYGIECFKTENKVAVMVCSECTDKPRCESYKAYLAE